VKLPNNTYCVFRNIDVDEHNRPLCPLPRGVRPT
jgi:hypothetical protein